MNTIYRTLKNIIRLRYLTFTIIVFAFITVLLLLSSFLIINVCNILKAKTENPYSDYYRILIDRRIMDSTEGFENANKTIAPGSFYIKDINDYFLNIIDYTAEYSNEKFVSLNPFTIESIKDNGNIFTIYSIIECTAVNEFMNGDITLKEGRYLNKHDSETENNVCLISDVVSEINNVKIGDSFYIDLNDELKKTMLVVGIFHNNKAENLEKTPSSNMLKNNYIYTPIHILEKTPSFGYNYQIKLDDDYHITKIDELVNKYGLNEGFPSTFIKVSDLYKAQNNNIHTLINAFNIVVVLCFVLALISLFLFINSAINSRKKEIAVYIAIGVNKIKIIISMVLEIFISSFLGIIPALIIYYNFGIKAAQKIIDNILKSFSVEAVFNTTSDLVKTNNYSNEIINSLIDYNFLGENINKVIIILLIILFVSSAFAIIKITSQKPMKIFAKQVE